MSAQRVSYGAAGSEPFDIDRVIARVDALRDADGKRVFQQVRGAADLGEVQEIKDFRAPEAFVVLVIERGKPMPGQTRQPAIAAFAVVIAGRNYSYQHGKPAMDGIRPLIGKVRDALVGWIPADGDSVASRGARGCLWQQGGVVDYDAGTVVWSEIFLVQHFIGSKPQ